MGAKFSKSSKGEKKWDEMKVNGKSLPENFDKTSTLPASFRRRDEEVVMTGTLPRSLNRNQSFSKRFRKSCKNWAAQRGLIDPCKAKQTETQSQVPTKPSSVVLAQEECKDKITDVASDVPEVVITKAQSLDMLIESTPVQTEASSNEIVTKPGQQENCEGEALANSAKAEIVVEASPENIDKTENMTNDSAVHDPEQKLTVEAEATKNEELSKTVNSTVEVKEDVTIEVSQETTNETQNLTIDPVTTLSDETKSDDLSKDINDKTHEENTESDKVDTESAKINENESVITNETPREVKEEAQKVETPEKEAEAVENEELSKTVINENSTIEAKEDVTIEASQETKNETEILTIDPVTTLSDETKSDDLSKDINDKTHQENTESDKADTKSAKIDENESVITNETPIEVKEEAQKEETHKKEEINQMHDEKPSEDDGFATAEIEINEPLNEVSEQKDEPIQEETKEVDSAPASSDDNIGDSMQINEAESIQSSESSPLTVVDKEIQDSSIIEDITQTTSDEITKENSTESESNEKQPEILSKEVIETVSEVTLDETPTAQISDSTTEDETSTGNENSAEEGKSEIETAQETSNLIQSETIKEQKESEDSFFANPVEDENIPDACQTPETETPDTPCISAIEDIKEVKEADHITSCEIISEKVQESESCADQCKEIDVLVGEAQITVDASNNDIQQLVETEVIEGDESIHSTDNNIEEIVKDATGNEKKDHGTVNSEKLDKNEDSICTPSDECKADEEHLQENTTKQDMISAEEVCVEKLDDEEKTHVVEDAQHSVDDLEKVSDCNDVIRSSDGIWKVQWSLPCLDGEAAHDKESIDAQKREEEVCDAEELNNMEEQIDLTDSVNNVGIDSVSENEVNEQKFDVECSETSCEPEAEKETEAVNDELDIPDCNDSTSGEAESNISLPELEVVTTDVEKVVEVETEPNSLESIADEKDDAVTEPTTENKQVINVMKDIVTDIVDNITSESEITSLENVSDAHADDLISEGGSDGCVSTDEGIAASDDEDKDSLKSAELKKDSAKDIAESENKIETLITEIDQHP